MRFTWILVLVAVIVALYIYVKVIISRLFFTFDVASLDFNTIKQSILTSKTVDIPIKIGIRNDNNFDIKFSDLYFELSHNGKVIARIKQKDLKEYTVPKKSSLTFTEDLTLELNQDTLPLAQKILSKQTVTIDYMVDIKLYGVKIPTIKDKFNLP